MKFFFSFGLVLVLLNSCDRAVEVSIPVFTNAEKTIQGNFDLDASGSPFIKVLYNNKAVFDTISLGLIRSDSDFSKNLVVKNIEGPTVIHDDYHMFQGKKTEIQYTANQYIIHLENASAQKLDIQFNLSDDGIAFRYYFPENPEAAYTILEEKTAYAFPDSTLAWLQPMSKAKSGWLRTNPSYEELYSMGISVDTPSPIGEGWVYPALFKTGENWMLISETNLARNYCGTRLKYDTVKKAMAVTFPQVDEIFPEGGLLPQSQTDFYSPWRIVTLGSLNTIIESTLGTDLAAPAIDMDTSFVKPGIASWSWILLKDDSVNYEITKEYIDYASKMHWPYCLVDADWNKRIGEERLQELVNYGNKKGVKLLVWYNSSGSWNDTVYEPKSKLTTAENRQQEFAKLQKMGVAGVKIDFFGGDGQSMIAYYHDILKDAATYKLLINFHGATLPRGWQRTYPHLMTTEAIKGEEFITFQQDGANMQPSHCAMLPFTRNAFDPMDFTPMVLDSIPNIHRRTTPAFELALPVLFLSGIQHLAEGPTGMHKMPDFVKEYLQDIPTQWDESHLISGFPGEYAVIARRKKDTWFISGINGKKEPLDLQLDLSFLTKTVGFSIVEATDNFLQKQDVNLGEEKNITITLPAYGGFVMKF